MTDIEQKLTARVAELELALAGRQAAIGKLQLDLAAADAELTRLSSALVDDALARNKPSPSATIDSDEEFVRLLGLVCLHWTCEPVAFAESRDALITHIDAYVSARLAAAGPQWISMADKMPPKGESVLIFYPQDIAEPYRIDMWDEWHEDPIGMGGPTICVGEGFMSFGDDDIEYWMPLPAIAAAMFAAEGDANHG